MTPLLAQRPRPDRAFERIYRRHVGDVYRYALAVMRNQADAEDITQTTFMNAYRAFQRGERPEKPQNWLIAIAHNVCRQRFRQAARRPAEVAFDEDVGGALVEPEEAPSGEDIRRALGHLAFNQRAALVMRELEGRSYAEIGEILELSPSAVETLIFRARRALREQLESSLTCGEAELAISRQLDGRLDRREKGALRGHLRECKPCAAFARRQRAQRSALKSLAAIPVPPSVLSLFGGGASVGGGVAIKAAVAVTAGVAIGGASYAGVHSVVTSDQPKARVATATVSRTALVPASVAAASPPARAMPDSPKRDSRAAASAQRGRHAGTAPRRVRGHRGSGGLARGHARHHTHRGAKGSQPRVSQRPLAPPARTVLRPPPHRAAGKPPHGRARPLPHGNGRANGHTK
jgi:RNA polymerase sigma factor (sigma-70 family)